MISKLAPCVYLAAMASPLVSFDGDCMGMAWHGRCSNKAKAGPFCGTHDKGLPYGLYDPQQGLRAKAGAPAAPKSIAAPPAPRAVAAPPAPKAVAAPPAPVKEELQDERGAVQEELKEEVAVKEEQEEEMAEEEKQEEATIKEEQAAPEPHKKKPRKADSRMSPATLAEVEAQLSELNDPSSKHVGMFRQYSEFCIANKAELGRIRNMGPMVHSKFGKVFVKEHAFEAFLVSLQKESPVLAKTLANKFGLLKKGLLQTDLPAGVMPAWAQAGASPPPAVATYLKKLAANQATNRGAVKEKGVITPQDVELHCIDLAIQVKEARALIEQVMGALWARVSSGRQIREINTDSVMMSDVGWHPAGADGHSYPYLEVAITKPLAKMSVSGAVNAQPKSTITLSDDISICLFEAWMDWVPPHIQGSSNNFFFPGVGEVDFIYDQPMGNATGNRIVQHIASKLELVKPGMSLDDFTTISLRKGTAVQSTHVVQEDLAAINKLHGRAPGSNLDLTVYAPANVLLCPGQLVDKEASNAAFAIALENHFGQLKGELLCKVCGYPACPCTKCRKVSAGTRSNILHECWKKDRPCTVGKRSKKWDEESDEQWDARLAAWSSYGIKDMSIFDKGEYSF